jgi:peptidoglycan/LPS O-acetylase OafA/YrhL
VNSETLSPAVLDPRFTDRERQPGLDLLRALAIVFVVFYHGGIFGFKLPSDVDRFGWIGVDLFFVLSGYLIGGQLLAPLARAEPIKLGRFFARRALRIMPAYFVVLAIYFCLPSLREYPSISPLWKFLISVQNINLTGGTSFSHAWSLAIEDQFYLLLPFALVFLNGRPRASWIVAATIVISGLCLRAYLALHFPGDDGVSFRGYQKFIYYPTWTRLDPLVLGVGIAAIRRFHQAWWTKMTKAAVWLWLPALGAIVLALYLGEGKTLTVTACISQFPLIAFGMAGLLVCVLSPRAPLSRVRIPGAAFLASIAYSVYLSHKLVIHQVSGICAARGFPLTSATALLLVQLSIYVAGAALFFAVERPFLQLRHRLTNN